jgi:hypothetical protein
VERQLINAIRTIFKEKELSNSAGHKHIVKVVDAFPHNKTAKKSSVMSSSTLNSFLLRRRTKVLSLPHRRGLELFVWLENGQNGTVTAEATGSASI